MVAGLAHKIIMGPGKLIIDPTNLSLSSPFGGTEVGLIESFILQNLSEPFLVWNESLGEPTDIKEGKREVVASCLARGWDDDLVEQLLPSGQAEGSTSKHRMYDYPGTVVPGASILGNGVILLFEPDDELHVPALIIRNAIPYWNPSIEQVRNRKTELITPVAFHCLRDASLRIITVGMLSDLSL